MRPITNRLLLATAISGSILVLFSVFSAKVLDYYGIGLFVATPFVAGLALAMVAQTPWLRPIATVCAGSLGALVGSGALMLLTGFEGLICLLMAAPIVGLFLLAGTILVLVVQLWRGKKQAASRSPGIVVLGMVLTLTLGMSAEPMLARTAPLRSVQTRVLIDAPIEEIWGAVVEFPPITSPPEGILAYGIAYPVSASIEGIGVGAIRRCTFNTGDFIEPITVWAPPNQLGFDVAENAPPMEEWSPFGPIDTSHLDGFIAVERGQFQLQEQEDGAVLLVGTTWYRQDLWPNVYWGAISDGIIHRIHQRVLEHIKAVSEQGRASIPRTGV
ncbi:MAG: hypothetical protein KF886_24955 [Candidatus Hydrogenedentes bacterium]|nr:hypothetical protein [Candidatus Hydrogenedentota bacterium]